MSEPLKACPMCCGGIFKWTWFQEDGNHVAKITCFGCGLSMSRENEKKARAAWNRRAFEQGAADMRKRFGADYAFSTYSPEAVARLVEAAREAYEILLFIGRGPRSVAAVTNLRATIDALKEPTMADPKYLRSTLSFCIAHLVEECGEVLAAAGKTQRWGLTSVNPELPPEQQETNVAWLMREVVDLEGAIARLKERLISCGLGRAAGLEQDNSDALKGAGE